MFRLKFLAFIVLSVSMVIAFSIGSLQLQFYFSRDHKVVKANLETFNPAEPSRGEDTYYLLKGDAVILYPFSQGKIKSQKTFFGTWTELVETYVPVMDKKVFDRFKNGEIDQFSPEWIPSFILITDKYGRKDELPKTAVDFTPTTLFKSEFSRIYKSTETYDYWKTIFPNLNVKESSIPVYSDKEDNGLWAGIGLYLLGIVILVALFLWGRSGFRKIISKSKPKRRFYSIDN